MGSQHLIVDKEMTRNGLRISRQDQMGGIGHDLG
jgi:hypothetical protein